MIDIKIILDSTRQLKQSWKSTCDIIESETFSSELYDVLCEVDEAIGNLIEKVGDATKTIAISSINR